MPGTASVSGIISGLQTDEIISKLIELQRAPIVRLQAQRNSLNAKLQAWQECNTRILALKTKADSLANLATFNAKTVTSSDETIIRGSASSSALEGTYYLKVNALARAEQRSTQGFADTTVTSIGTGTVTITVGSGAPVEITIDETNCTLAGLRDAINRANAGVSATIVNDGSASNPYRLLITSKTMGEAGALEITSTLSGGVTPNFDTVIQSAQNASVTLGEGENAITIQKNSNTITDLIAGVTLDLRKADTNALVSITVGNDTASVKQAITDFVTQYNNLVDFINQQFTYNPETNTAGTLFADSNLQAIQTNIINKLFAPVSNLNQTIKLLSQVGITSVTSDGRLTVEETKLDEALANSIADVRRLFAAVGECTHGAISFVTCTNLTKPSGPDGYAIEISAVASQARVTAGVAQTANLTQDEILTLNGVEIHLTSGMTPAQVVARINEYTSQTGITASRTDANGSGTGDYLTLTRVQYGAGFGISVVSSVSNGGSNPRTDTSGVGNLAVTQTDYAGESGTGTGAPGTDVAGTINGEPATGTGQILVGNKENENTSGLRIKVSAQTPGSYGVIVLTKGVAASLSDYLTFVTDADHSPVDDAKETLQSKIQDIDDDVKRLEERITARQERLILQFAAMESALKRLQSQGDFLAGRLSSATAGWK